MPQGVASKGIASEKNYVYRENEGAHADVEAVLPPHRVPGIFRQEKDENHRDIHEVTMDILNNQRERSFAEILLARLAHGAVWRVHPPRFVVSAPIVVAGNSKAAGSPQDQKRCRERQKCREP